MTRKSPLPLPKKVESTSADELPVAGAVYLQGQWLEQAVSLVLLAWLKPVQEAGHGRISAQLQRDILAACRRLKSHPPSVPFSKRGLHRDMQVFRHKMLEAINQASERIPKQALSALQSARHADVRYECDGPFGPDGEWTTTDFSISDIEFGNPAWALEAMVKLRKLTFEAQGEAMQLLIAKRDDQRSAYSMFNEEIPQRVRNHWVKKAGIRLSHSNRSTDDTLQLLVDAIWHGMQCASGTAPFAVALPGNASDDVLMKAAEGYRDLRWSLHQRLVRRPVGDDSECRRAQRAWAVYGDCAMACQVIASWLSALGAAGPGSRCEFCYRHRGTRRRCHEHTVPESMTPEARVGQVLAKPFVLRVQALTANPEIRMALAAERDARALDLGAMRAQAQLAQVPTWLQDQAALLASQLRTLWPILGNRLALEVETLFAAMLHEVSLCCGGMPLGTPKKVRGFKDLRTLSAELLTFRGFLMLWWGRGRPFRPLKLVGLGHDPAYPQMRYSVIDSSVAHSFLRQRAWLEVEEEFLTSTTLDLDRVIALRVEGKSLRKIAVLLGCSHEKIRKLLTGPVEKRRKRAVLRPYLGANAGLGSYPSIPQLC